MSVEPQTPSFSLQRELFLGALEKQTTRERKEYLDAACGQNVELRHRIEALLRERDTVGNFLERPVWTTTCGRGPVMESEAHPVAPITERPGDMIGQYKLVQKVGEGGCGVVYRAQQERPFRREVALKVIKLGMDTRKVIARFEAERQTLALMNHSSIAKVLDAGATQTGRPFFVMELVHGIKLTQHCDQNRLGLEERLRLFIQVCQGIQHAHQMGVIHRDIKPSNILVALQDGHAVPKIIDFGVARAIHRQLTDQLTEMTGFGQLIGTPAYMSPEQVTMRPVEIDTRSDIYSLGALLYELLTGRTPFDSSLMAQDPDEWRRIIREHEPPKPSTRLSALTREQLTEQANKLGVEPMRLVQALVGDLDWVVMKALEKDRIRRYATARELAQDLGYYLGNEPVLARPPSRMYRLQKLLQRHRTAFATLTGVAALLLIATTISTGLALRATRAETDARLSEKMQVQLRRQAELERERAQAQADAARRNEYVADINLAQQALDSGNYGRAVELLSKHLPQRGAIDLRGFEWRYLWRLSRGDEHVRFPDQGSSVRSLTVSPTGRYLAVGTDDRLNLWDLQSTALIRSFPVHQASAAFCSEDRQLVFNTPNEIRVFDLGSGTETNLSDQDSGVITASKDVSLLAVSGRDGVRVWDTKTWTPQGSLADAFAPVTFSPDGKSLAAGTREGIAVWEIKEPKPKVILKNSRRLLQLQRWNQLGRVIVFTADGLRLVAPRNMPDDRGMFQLRAWNVQSGEEVEAFPQDAGHTGTIAWLAVSPDGKSLATASMDHSIRIWDLESPREPTVLHGHFSEVWSVAFSPDDRTLISGAKDGSVNLWTVPPAPKQDLLEGRFTPIGFSRDGRRMAVLDYRREAILFLDPATRQTQAEIQLERAPWRGPVHYAMTADLQVVAQAIGNNAVRLYNTTTKESTDLKVDSAADFELTLSPDGKQLITGGFNQPLRWWDVASGTNKVFPIGPRRVLFSPDGNTLLVLSESGRAELWNVATRSPRVLLRAESTLGHAAAFSPDGHIVAIASHPLNPEQKIGLWDTTTGHPLGACIGHKQGIGALTFSSDGKTLASVSADSTLKLWSTSTLQQLLNFSVPAGANSPLFSPDGTILAVGHFFQHSGIRFYSAPDPEVEKSQPANRAEAAP